MKKKIVLATLLSLFGTLTYANNASEIPVTQQKSTPAIHCDYPIPANIQTIDPAILKAWAQAALMQSFEFNATDLDTQLAQLKPCFTTQGFQSFYDAFKTSGNMDEIKAKHLTVHSQIDGELHITPIRDNQWQVIIPLQVTYQNDKQTVTQLLSVELLVGRRAAGNLGIMQVIAKPRELGS